MARAASSLARRDLSVQELGERLARKGVPPAARDETVERLAHAGAVDDGRLARRRAEQLAERGAGDALIRHDLEHRGITSELIEGALAALAPERERAARVVEVRGGGEKTARYLARKGFDQEAIEEACSNPVAEDAPPAVR